MLALKGKALERLRAKDAREKATEERRAERLAKADARCGTVERFLSFIDTSDGPHACHPWCGAKDVNHRQSNQPNLKAYEVGVYTIEGYSSPFAHRIAVMVAFGLTDLPEGVDIAPTCGDHLCCNLNHLVVRQNRGKDRVENSIPVHDYFCAVATQAAGRAALEQAADKMLAA